MAQLKFISTVDGSRVGESIEVAKACFTIGRHEDDLVISSDGLLSRDHALIERTAEGHLLRDCGSVNGTWVNEQRISAQLLRDGDTIRLGETRLRYVSSSALCRACGARLAGDAKFCGGCGAAAAPTSVKAPDKPYPSTRIARADSVPPTADEAPKAKTPAPVVAEPKAPVPAAAAPKDRRPIVERPRRSSWPVFVGGVLVGGLAVGAVMLFVVPRLRDSGEGDGAATPAAGSAAAKVAPTKPATATKADSRPALAAKPAPALRYERKAVDLSRGGTVVLGGVAVTVQPATGKRQGEVLVRRVALARAPPGRGGGGITDAFDIRVTQGDADIDLGRPVGLVIPLAAGAKPPLRERPVVLTRADATKPWKVERALVFYHAPSRALHFTLPHLCVVVGSERGTMLDKMLSSARQTLSAGKQALGAARAKWLPRQHLHESPSKFFKIYYYKTGRHALRYPSWNSLSGKDVDPTVPHFVEDVGVYLERVLPKLVKIGDGRGKMLFAAKWVKTLKPIVVRILDLGTSAGESPLAPPLLLSTHAIKNEAQDLESVAAHELIHVLQDRYYVNPITYKSPHTSMLSNPLSPTKWKWEYGSTAVVAGRNRWFVEATAELWTPRVVPSFDRSRWFKESKGYLAESLTGEKTGTMYAAAHFLEFLEGKLGRPVAAQAMIDGDNRPNDLANLERAVGLSGAQSFDKIYDLYARTMYIGKSPSGFSPQPTQIMLGVDRHDLVESLTNYRPPLSAGLFRIAISRKSVPQRSGLLVIDFCSSHDQIKTYTYLKQGDPERYLEKPEVGGTMMIRRGCARALPKMGGARNALHMVQVNVAKKARPSIIGFWLLLEPREVAYEKGTVTWKHQRKGLDAKISHYNIYVDDRRLNAKPVKGDAIQGGKRGFRAPGLTAEQQDKLWVSVVDVRGFEWPRGRPLQGLSGRWRIAFRVDKARRHDPPLVFDFDQLKKKGWKVGRSGVFVTFASPGYARLEKSVGGSHGTKLWINFVGKDRFTGRARMGRVEVFQSRVQRRWNAATISGTRVP